MKVDLAKITFDSMEEDLKKEIKKDISNFELNLYENDMSVHLSLKSKEDIILNCGNIMNFEYPKGSQEQNIVNPGISVEHTRAIKINFLYNKKRYTIQSHI